MIKKFDKKKLISRLEYFIDIENEIKDLKEDWKPVASKHFNLKSNEELIKILLDLKKYILKNDTKNTAYVINQLNFITNELIPFVDIPRKVSKIKRNENF